MRNIRRSRAVRATAWLLTLALIMPILALDCIGARAQSIQVLRVIVADFVNKGKYGGDQLGIEARDAVYNELVNSGQGRFYVFGSQEVTQEAKRIGLRVPSEAGKPAYFSRTDLLRLAKELQADAIVEGEVGTPAPAKNGRTGNVALGIRIMDVASQEYINGGYAIVKPAPRPGQTADAEELINQGITDAALSVVREAVQRQQVSATVLQRVGDTIVLNRGLRDGIREGDNLVIIRETTVGGRVKQGVIRVARAYATDAEAEVRQEIGAIRPEDIARVLYSPNWVITPGTGEPGHTPPSVRAINFSLIGSTLAVLGIGVLIAQGTRGGQASVTSVVAEPTTDSQGNPRVRVRWNDNIFGQSGVIQYHIYRNPDFPYSPNVQSNQNGGTANNNTLSAYPVGVTDSLTRVYYDQPVPYNPFLTQAITVAPSASSTLGNSNNSSNNNNNGGNSSQQGGCMSILLSNNTTTTTVIPTEFGFTPGRSYTYQVTAIIQVKSSSSSSGSNGSGSGTGTGSGSGTGTGTGTGTGSGNNGSSGNNNSSGAQCVETDPVPSQQATPLQPVIISSPLSTETPNLRNFAISFNSVVGADIYQLEISPDFRFRNAANIFRVLLPPNASSQNVRTITTVGIDLMGAAELNADPIFAAFVKSNGTAASPTLYARVGARRDDDSPGPVNWIDPNSSNGDKTFRFVYSPVGAVGYTSFSFTAVTTGGNTGGTNPPSGPGRSIAAKFLNQTGTGRAAGSGLPRPGQSIRARSTQRSVGPPAFGTLPGVLSARPARK